MFRVSQGFGITSNPYNKETNNKNNAFGTKILDNNYFLLQYQKQNLIDKIGLQAGFMLTHFSNGRFKAPNSGINSFTFNVGLNYNFDEEREFIRDSLPSNSSYKERVEKIKRLESFILNESNHQIIADALYKDLRKPNEEVITTEITPTLLNIKHVLKNLKNWMKDEHVPSPITMVGMSSYIKYESKGTLLLISPWNYPIFLSLYPLIYAIAAGNAIILKPSEI